ncbi:MAG: polysaccharide biosynthesis C-terminal domain-containing protein [Muribaculaceae bacterium]|nr:polysaccharide biosynthesis C-terminal domain-containing protein [Muribaculaceae bacterium]
MSIKALAKDTAVYGLSSILGRFLNWCLVPLYVYLFPTEEYGIVTYLYGVTAVMLVVLNYGMETGFFRFANKEEDPGKVYTTSLISVGFTSLAFLIVLTVFLQPISNALKLPNQSLFVWLIGATVAVDAFCNLPFAYLRYKNKSWRFAGIKLINVALNIGLNLFFLLLCPLIAKSNPGFISWFYQPLGGESFGIGWIFVANIISSYTILILLMPQLIGRAWRFSGDLLKRMLSYSWPLLILAIAGMLSQNMGQLLMPYLISDEEAARSMIGIYGANMKIAIVMVMFTQAFRYAYEPFIFSQAKKAGETSGMMYADAMKYFIIFGWLIFLGVMFYLPFVRYFISPNYWSGLQVVPVMMGAELCFGVFFNLSLWYKLTDKTRWGMYLSLMCFAIMLGLNIWLVPFIGIPNGYMGSAWGALAAYFAVMVISYFLGKKYYPLPYDLKSIASYTVLAAVFYIAGILMELVFPAWALYVCRTLLILIYAAIVALFENIPVISPLMRRFSYRLTNP